MLHYQAAADGMSYVVSAWDVRTGTVYCINTNVDPNPVEMSMAAGSGDIQCLRSFTAPGHAVQ